jgi:LuxR family maltose regulon positive regulatory protein
MMHEEDTNVDTAPRAMSSLWPDQLLATKLHVPRPRKQLVQRSHLTERLQHGMEHALTLVSAPAGFGKTTLLSQWLADSGIRVAWLSLEQEDNELVRFLSYMIAALQRLDPRIGMTALALLQAPQPAPPETVLTVLTNDLASREEGDFALVLDDYHVITTESIHRALTFLLEHLPPQMHLIIATRADPLLPLARLRAGGQLTEVRAAELRFSAAEISTFLQTLMGLDLTTEAIAAFESRTEGWIAGLQLAALSLRGQSDVSRFMAAFKGSHRFVLDYLSEEVLSRQPAPVQTFLLYTSILERLSGPLCDAVTGQEKGQATLEALDKANLFVVSLDDERRWFRYHHLFAEVLLSRLQQAEPTLIPELHRRASTWYEQNDLPIEAVQHALAAPDFEHAAGLTEQVGLSVALRGQVHTVLSWLNALPDTQVYAHPRLSLYYAVMLMFTNQMEAAETRLQDLEQRVQVDTPNDQVREILGQIAVTRANLVRYSGDLAHAVALARQALDLLPEKDRFRLPAMVGVAHTYLLNGDVTPPSEHLATAALAPLWTSGDLFVFLNGITCLARLQGLQGQLHRAVATYGEAVRMMTGQEGPQFLVGSSAYYFGLGDVLREWNDLDTAERLLLQGIDLVKGTLLVDGEVVTLGYTALARLQQARGDYSGAFATLGALAQLARQRHFVLLLVARGLAVQAQVELAQGNLAAAIRWVDESGLSPYDDDLSYPREQEYLTLARVRIAQGRDHPLGPYLQDALHLLDRLLEDAEAKARMGSALEILVLRALALHAQGDRTGALSTLERALMLAEPEGYVRLFMDEGAPMLVLLRQAHARGMTPGYVTTLLTASGWQGAVASPLDASRASSLIEPLTEREREVLQLLGAGASNRDIARRLVLSVGTVKKHVSNICGKLSVQSRTQAIARARALDLL